MRYDERYHLHIGYYENDADFEAIAFKRETEDIWDIFFDFNFYHINNSQKKDSIEISDYGTFIFSVETVDLSYDVGAEKFKEWLSMRKII